MFKASTIADSLRRFIAAGAAALVLTLTFLAASPEAHERVHHDCHHDEEHRCAVVLFAQGIWAPFETVAVPIPEIAWSEFVPVSRPRLYLVAPRYLRQPERGPPLC